MTLDPDSIIHIKIGAGLTSSYCCRHACRSRASQPCLFAGPAPAELSSRSDRGICSFSCMLPPSKQIQCCKLWRLRPKNHQRQRKLENCPEAKGWLMLATLIRLREDDEIGRMKPMLGSVERGPTLSNVRATTEEAPEFCRENPSTNAILMLRAMLPLRTAITHSCELNALCTTRCHHQAWVFPQTNLLNISRPERSKLRT